ncbi:hypothetical protein ASD11_00900 [Aeromicrobium sp. Root495]|nr:hypothetical protein ASD11_00900 [Aeromicrobium sp. Root495]
MSAELARAKARISAQEMAAARALESAGTARKAGATSTGNLLARDFGGDEAAGHRLVKTAAKLAKTTHTQDALARGEVTFEQSSVIATGLDKLPGDVTETQRDLAERTLLKDAERLTIRDLRRRTDRLMDVYAAKPDVDAHENNLLIDREQAARRNASFVMWDKKNGMHGFRGEVPEAEAVMLRTALEALAAPSRAHLTDPDATLGPVPEDVGDPAHRMGRAFTDLCSHLPVEELPSNGGVGAQVVVTLEHQTLIDGIAPATLSDGTRLSASQARKLACRVGIIPMVLDGTSLPTEYGQSKRYFTKHQRIALANRDGGCSFPTCDRPPEWTEAHHLTPYSVGGKTDLQDGTLLCTRHHHHVHDHHWEHRIAADGHVEWRPPGSSAWQRNSRHRA